MIESGRDNYSYLLRMIRESQRKTTADWNTLVRLALIEIDQQIKENAASETEILTFEEYRRHLRKLAETRGFDMERIEDGSSGATTRRDPKTTTMAPSH